MGLIKFKKGFLDMSKIEMISHQIVLIDDTFSKLKLGEENIINLNNISNPFRDIANPIVLKGLFKDKVVEIKSEDMIKEFACGNFLIKYEVYPSRLKIIHKTSNEKSNIKDIVKEIISLVDKKYIFSIGINYEMFVENKNPDIIKDTLLKSKISEEFTGLSITPVLKIDDNTTLNLKIANCEHNNKTGIYFAPNFHSNIKDEEDIESILKENFINRAKNKIESIFG